MVNLGMPAYGHGNLTLDAAFPDAAKEQMENAQMRENIRHATHSIRSKRNDVVAELPDWEELRNAGSAIKEGVMARLPELLERFEREFTARGGVVHLSLIHI